MQTAGPAQPLGEEQPGVLEVALAPAAIALGAVDHRGRALLEAAVEIVGKPHAPAGPGHQRGLDEVVAEDAPAERLRAGQVGQAAMLHELRGADHRVVSPEIAFALLPVVQAGEEHRAVEPVGELLEAGEERLAPDQPRHALQDAHLRVALHQLHHPDQRAAGHDAVGVEHGEVAVLAAPAAEEVGHVAALLVYPLPALAVEDAAEAAHLLAQLHPGELLLDPFVGVGGVAEDEEVEVRQLARLLQRAVDHAQALEHPAGVLVAHRHDDRRRPERGVDVVEPEGALDAPQVAAAVEHVEAEQRMGETGGDVREQDDEQRQHHPLDRAHVPGPGAAVPEQVRHEPRRQGGEQEDRREEQETPLHHAAAVETVGDEKCGGGGGHGLSAG